MISCPGIEKKVIQNHYDVSTLFYRLLWGPHIHHGLWEGEESARVAALQLTKRLALLARIQRGERVYDIGCGMGGSSIYLAKEFGCDVTGVTISPVQKKWAHFSAAMGRLQPRPNFLCQDAENLRLDPETLDVLWSIECTEHLFDKEEFFRRSGTWLRKGGRVALCAWLAGDNESDPATQQQVLKVCEGMFCPSLGTAADYDRWLVQAGLERVVTERWTSKVWKTWEICRRRVDRSQVRWLARLLGQNHSLFLNRFDAILQAFQSGAMEYDCFVYQKVGKS